MGAFDDLVPKKAGGAFDDLTPKVEQNSGILGDTVTDVKRGFEQLPGALTGLADIVNPLTYTNNRRYFDEGADWIGKKTGFQPGKWQEAATKEYSPEPVSYIHLNVYKRQPASRSRYPLTSAF